MLLHHILSLGSLWWTWRQQPVNRFTRMATSTMRTSAWSNPPFSKSISITSARVTTTAAPSVIRKDSTSRNSSSSVPPKSAVSHYYRTATKKFSGVLLQVLTRCAIMWIAMNSFSSFCSSCCFLPCWFVTSLGFLLLIIMHSDFLWYNGNSERANGFGHGNNIICAQFVFYILLKYKMKPNSTRLLCKHIEWSAFRGRFGRSCRSTRIYCFTDINTRGATSSLKSQGDGDRRVMAAS